MKLYLSGPMTGVPRCNFPAFDEACTKLRAAGHSVISPHEQDSPALQAASRASPNGVNTIETTPGESLGRTLGNDVRVIIDEVDGVVFLPAWDASRGARIEAFVALTFNKQFAYFDRGAKNALYEVSHERVREVLKRCMP